MNGGDPWVRTKDGIETPFLLRKRVPDVCQLSCGFMSSVRDALFLFYFILFTVFTWRMRFVLPYMARCANYLRWVVILMRLNFRYGVAVTLVVPFYVIGNKSIFTQRGDNSLFPESKNACA